MHEPVNSKGGLGAWNLGILQDLKPDKFESIKKENLCLPVLYVFDPMAHPPTKSDAIELPQLPCPNFSA